MASPIGTPAYPQDGKKDKIIEYHDADDFMLTKNVNESVAYRRTLTIDHTTSTQGEYPPNTILDLFRYRDSIPEINTSVEFYKWLILGNKVTVNCDDEEANAIIEKFMIDTDFFTRLTNVVDMTLVTGLGLFQKVYDPVTGELDSVEDFDVSTIERIERDNHGNLKTVVQRLANSGLTSYNNNKDFVRIVFINNARQYYGRSIFHTLATPQQIKDRGLPPIAERYIQMCDVAFSTLENYAYPKYFLQIEGMDDKQKQLFRDKVSDWRPGENFIVNEMPIVGALNTAAPHTNYTGYMQFLQQKIAHGTGFPLEILQGDFTSRASSVTTNHLFMEKIYGYQVNIQKAIINDIFLPLLALHTSGKWATKEARDGLNIQIMFKTVNPRDWTPDNIISFYDRGLVSLDEVREYGKSNGLDFFDDDMVKAQVAKKKAEEEQQRRDQRDMMKMKREASDLRKSIEKFKRDGGS